MALCPAGHESQTNDYCDTCGALMGGAPVTPGADLASTAVMPGEGGPAGSVGGSCPQCGADRGGRFCEECGFDYELAELVPQGTAFPTTVPPPGPGPTSAGSSNAGSSNAGSSNAGSSSTGTANGSSAAAGSSSDSLAATSALPPGYDLDAEFEAAERAFAESGGAGATSAPAGSAGTASSESSTESGTVTGTSTGTGSSLVAVVTADQEYYTAQVERGDIVESEFPFPRYPGERRFALGADRVRIGRASASRGIAVEIDLTGPPLDPAVSHLHAQLQRSADGSWALVDLNSANGTRLNGAADPLPAETEIPVKAGDRIHLGVWTTLTLEEA